MTDKNLDLLKIQLTKEAKNQLLLIKKCDPFLQNSSYRLKIDGKGCGGFDYAFFVEDQHYPDDETYSITEENETFNILIDPFTKFYLGEVSIDYQINHVSNEDGFIIKNSNEQHLKGKFWKKNPKLVPQG